MFEELVRFFGRYGRLLERLVRRLRSQSASGQTSGEDGEIEDTREILRDTAEEAREVVSEWVQENLPSVYGDTSTSEQEDYRDSVISRAQKDLTRAATDMEEQADSYLSRLKRFEAEARLAGSQGDAPQLEGVWARDGAGRQMEPEAYARLVLNTVTRELENSGILHRAALDGSPGVLVEDNEGPNSCETCEQANGQTWALSYALANKTEHPNCIRRFSPLPNNWQGVFDRE